MQVHFGLGLLRAEWSQSVVCIGTCDGVHMGHRAVVSEAVRSARDAQAPGVLVTFDRHPAAVLAPERCPMAISSLYQNLSAFEDLGVSVAVILEFDQALSQTTAETFFRSVIIERLHATKMVVGHDFAFGRGREGDPEWLRQRIETQVVPPLQMDGVRVSSSAIRQAVADGRVEEAARWLGRPFEVTGVVVVGQRLGRSLGFPTVNIARSFEQVTPADGVYAGLCKTPSGIYPAAVNIGLRPAVGGTQRTIEAFLLDYTGEELYGCAVHLSLVRRLREERKFASLDALRDQMARDVDQVARYMNDESQMGNRVGADRAVGSLGGAPCGDIQ